MNLVSCTVSDSTIWQLDKFIIDLVNASRHGPVTVDLKSEGPCCETINLDRILDSISGLTVDQILTCNQISSSRHKEKRLSFVELDLAKQKLLTTRPSKSSLNKTFALFVGRSNWMRLSLAGYLWNNYSAKSTISYHYDRNLDYHLENFGLETLLQKNWESRHDVYKFLENLPMTFDKQTYPILWNQSAFDLDYYYQDVFCEIVCETFFSGKTFMMTEKTMRPIIQRRPFIVAGPKFFLENLKKLGFKTFDRWWDESYDIDETDGKIASVQYSVDYIAQQDSATLAQWYQEMQPVLEHNANILSGLTGQQIVSTQFTSP